jgi:chromosome segregation protein
MKKRRRFGSSLRIIALPYPKLPAKALRPFFRTSRRRKSLNAALSQIGVVDSYEAGSRIWGDLKPGQALVSKDGNYWRWDGFSIRAEATDRHAQTLEQQNKLKALIKTRPQIEDLVNAARATLEEALMKQEAVQNSLKVFKRRKTSGRYNAERQEIRMGDI